MRSLEVIIPVYRPDSRFYILLERLLKQIKKPDRIKIMLTLTSDYGELDLIKGMASHEIKDKCISVVSVEKGAFNHGGTRQTAAEDSECDFCLFMTQDAVPKDKKLTARMIKSFEDKKTAVCYARQVPYKNAVLKEKFARQFNYPDTPQIKDRSMLDAGKIKAIFCSDVCAMYDMAKFKELDGFERDVDFNEDMLYAYKALVNGYNVRYCADAKVYHSHNLSLKAQFLRNKEIARSQEQHSEVFGKLNSEGEGLLYVKQGLKYIYKNGNIIDCLSFIADCGFRFAGFKVGKVFK